MSKYRGIKAEVNRAGIVTHIQRLFTLPVYADEDPAPAAGGNTPDDKGGAGNDPAKSGGAVINYEDLISKARQEEKQKQYKTIEGLRNQMATLTQQHNDDLMKIAALEKERDDAKTALTKAGSGDSEAVTTLKQQVSTLQGEKTALEQKVSDYEKNKPVSREEIETEVRKQLEAEYEVKAYRTQILADHKDELLVPELVIGDTKEALDQSMTAALARSAEIRKNLGLPETTTGGQHQSKPRTPKSPANPNTGTLQDKTFDMAAVAAMDVTSKEYAELRKKLGL